MTGATPFDDQGTRRRALQTTALAARWEHGIELAALLADTADRRTRALVEGFVHEAGPAPSRFAWVALGSHARRELHLASDQDHALIWATAQAAESSYAADLAAHVIAGLDEFGMRPCDGGYMADRWSMSLADWITTARARIEEPTPEAVLDTDVFLDVRPVVADLDLTSAATIGVAGADSPRLLHGLALAANSFTPPRQLLGRLHRGGVDLKRAGLAPLVLLARLYGLRARSTALGTVERLTAAGDTGQLSAELVDQLVTAFGSLLELRLAHQLAQSAVDERLTDSVAVNELTAADQGRLRDALKAVRAAQSVTAVTFRTDL